MINHLEKNDCAVRAVAQATRSSYEYTYKVFAELGRKPEKRTNSAITFAAVSFLGYKLKPVEPRGKTIRTLARSIPPGTYLVRVRGHMLCIRDGKVLDWADGRLFRIKEVYLVY